MSIEESLSQHLGKIGTAPFLFVGSGLSRRHIKLETWHELLRRFSREMPQPFEYYYGHASQNLPKTADLLADAFYERWWTDSAYESSRDAFKDQVKTRSSCLKYEISQYLESQKYSAGVDATVDAEIELLKQATIDGIITTNWDTSLETIFPDFEVFIGQNEVLFSVSQGIAEIYKIHGCCTVPNSLILTTEDYSGFNERNPYLAAKLLTIFVEHPVIFLGYSISDENVISILNQIASCLTNDNIQKLKDRLIFVQRDGENRGESFESSVTQIAGHALPLTVIRTNDLTKVYRPLGTQKRRFSARLLRKMKEHVYDLVRSNDPKGQLAVVDIDTADSFSELEIVYGVGVTRDIGKFGYSPISRVDLLKDVMAPESEYDPALLVQNSLPSLLQNTPFVPIFRYLRGAGKIASDGTINYSGLHPRVARTAAFQQANFYPPKAYRGEVNRVQKELKSVEAVADCYGENCCLYFSLLNREQVDVEKLRSYILTNIRLIDSKRSHTQTYFRRLICFYDWLAYR